MYGGLQFDLGNDESEDASYTDNIFQEASGESRAFLRITEKVLEENRESMIDSSPSKSQ